MSLPWVRCSAVLSVSTCLCCAECPGVAVEGEALVQPSVRKDSQRKNVALAAYRRLMNWRAQRAARARIDRTCGEDAAKSTRRTTVGVHRHRQLAVARGGDNSAPEEEVCPTEGEGEYSEDDSRGRVSTS